MSKEIEEFSSQLEGGRFENDGVSEPFQPWPTWEKQDGRVWAVNRAGSVVRWPFFRKFAEAVNRTADSLAAADSLHAVQIGSLTDEQAEHDSSIDSLSAENADQGSEIDDVRSEAESLAYQIDSELDSAVASLIAEDSTLGSSIAETFLSNSIFNSEVVEQTASLAAMDSALNSAITVHVTSAILADSAFAEEIDSLAQSATEKLGSAVSSLEGKDSLHDSEISSLTNADDSLSDLMTRPFANINSLFSDVDSAAQSHQTDVLSLAAADSLLDSQHDSAEASLAEVGSSNIVSISAASSAASFAGAVASAANVKAQSALGGVDSIAVAAVNDSVALSAYKVSQASRDSAQDSEHDSDVASLAAMDNTVLSYAFSGATIANSVSSRLQTVSVAASAAYNIASLASSAAISLGAVAVKTIKNVDTVFSPDANGQVTVNWPKIYEYAGSPWTNPPAGDSFAWGDIIVTTPEFGADVYVYTESGVWKNTTLKNEFQAFNDATNVSMASITNRVAALESAASVAPPVHQTIGTLVLQAYDTAGDGVLKVMMGKANYVLNGNNIEFGFGTNNYQAAPSYLGNTQGYIALPLISCSVTVSNVTASAANGAKMVFIGNDGQTYNLTVSGSPSGESPTALFSTFTWAPGGA